MIISYTHNFIFIKTKKTAGSSMEFALASHAGPQDVVTPLGYAQDVDRYREWPDALPRNFSSDKEAEVALADAVRREDRKAVRQIAKETMRREKKMLAERHGSASQAKGIVGETFWNAAFKFAVDRHPYEKAVSLAWYRAGAQGDFPQALDEVMETRGFRNFDLYSIDGKVAVDLMLRYENMSEDLPRLEAALGGLPVAARLPRANSHQRQDRRPAAEILSPQQKASIQEICREEFDLFGYQT